MALVPPSAKSASSRECLRGDNSKYQQLRIIHPSVHFCSATSSLNCCQIIYQLLVRAFQKQLQRRVSSGAIDETSVKSLRIRTPASQHLAPSSVSTQLFISGAPTIVGLPWTRLLLVAMALIDKVPGELRLYIGGYVMVQPIVSTFPTSSP